MISSLKKKNKPSSTLDKTTNGAPGGLLGQVARQFARACNLFCLLPTILAALAPFVSPERWWLPNILALFSPYWIIIPFVWLLAWIRFSKRWALVNLVVILAHYPYLSATYKFPPQPLRPSEKDVKVVSFNVKAFDYEFARLKEVTELLKAQNAEIICLQEFRNELDKGRRALPYLKRELGLPKHAFVELLKGSHYGLLILSKYPIKSFGNLNPEESAANGAMFADVRIFGQTLRVYNIHLESYNFSATQRRFLAGETVALAENGGRRRKNNAPPTSLRGSWKMLKVVLKASKEQARQTESYLTHSQKPPGPVLVCGDLNNPPYNYFYRQIKGKLKDCFVEQGSGFGKTYGRKWASFRIDYVFADPALRVTGFETLAADGVSDHNAVAARLRFR